VSGQWLRAAGVEDGMPAAPDERSRATAQLHP
jgi:hypothetical protein